MKIWTNNEFEGRWPVGTAAVVVAETKEIALDLLNLALENRGLPLTELKHMFELNTVSQKAVILCDGDY